MLETSTHSQMWHLGRFCQILTMNFHNTHKTCPFCNILTKNSLYPRIFLGSNSVSPKVWFQKSHSKWHRSHQKWSRGENYENTGEVLEGLVRILNGSGRISIPYTPTKTIISRRAIHCQGFPWVRQARYFRQQTYSHGSICSQSNPKYWKDHRIGWPGTKPPPSRSQTIHSYSRRTGELLQCGRSTTETKNCGSSQCAQLLIWIGPHGYWQSWV